MTSPSPTSNQGISFLLLQLFFFWGGVVIAATRSGCCHADPTNNKQAEQQTEPCRRYLNAVVVVRRLLLLLLLTGAGLRGLTSVIGWRMEAHYKISALCLSIRVTERALPLLPLLLVVEPSTRPETPQGLWVLLENTGGRNKAGVDVIKALDLQCLDTGATSGPGARRGRGYRSATISNFSHPSTSTPRGFHLQTGRETVHGKARHQACPCLLSEDANTLQIHSSRSTMGVWGDKGMK